MESEFVKGQTTCVAVLSQLHVPPITCNKHPYICVGSNIETDRYCQCKSGVCGA